MKSNHTDITIVLDRSGSMQSIASDTIGGFNKFLEDQKKAPGTATFTLNQFDDKFENVIEAKNIKGVNPLTGETFVPRGWTALLDAIGRTINETGTRLSQLPENERPSKVIFVIITDGMENYSKEFTHEKVNEMITHQRDCYQWEFVFLAANQDAIATGSKLGISAANSMTYAHNSKGTTRAFAAVSSNLTSMRSGRADTMAYTDKQREEQVDADAPVGSI